MLRLQRNRITRNWVGSDEEGLLQDDERRADAGRPTEGEMLNANEIDRKYQRGEGHDCRSGDERLPRGPDIRRSAIQMNLLDVATIGIDDRARRIDRGALLLAAAVRLHRTLRPTIEERIVGSGARRRQQTEDG